MEITIVGSFPYSYENLEIHLRAMSNGKEHPDALCPKIHYLRDISMGRIISSSITSSRMVMVEKALSNAPFASTLFTILDWKTGQVLSVSSTLQIVWQVELKHSYRCTITSGVHLWSSLMIIDY